MPLGTKDYSSVISSLPRDIDAIYVALGGSDALTFLEQYKQFGGKAPLIGGSSTVDQNVDALQRADGARRARGGARPVRRGGARREEA
ncbi:hypothetical protein WMF41_00985 [Sorangium sp. So ce1151]